jgi:hypothetical protein
MWIPFERSCMWPVDHRTSLLLRCLWDPVRCRRELHTDCVPEQWLPGAKHYRLSSAGAFEEAILCAAPNTKHVSQCRSHKCQRGSGRGSNVGGARPCRHSSCWVVLASLKLRSVECFLIYFVSSYFVIHAQTSCVLKMRGASLPC